MFWIPLSHICLHMLHITPLYCCTQAHRLAAPSQTHTLRHTSILLPMHFFPLFSIHKQNNCYIHAYTHHVLYQTHTLRHTQMHIHAQTLKFTQRGSCVEYRANAPDLKASPPPQMWHQLVLSLALPLLPLLPSSFLSSFISWAHLLTLQKVFLTCLSPLPSSTNAFFPALYREHASLSETYVLCRVNALAFASPWSW